MTKTLDELKEEAAMLRKHKAEEEERKALEAEIKSMREAGTWREKIKKTFKSTRAHLHEKGNKFREDGEKQQRTGFATNIGDMAKESNFGTPKEMLKQEIKTELYKELSKGRKKK